MTDLLGFLGEQGGLGCLYALGFGALAVVVMDFTFRVINRVLRTIKVAARGWPPEHLDADGDPLDS